MTVLDHAAGVMLHPCGHVALRAAAAEVALIYGCIIVVRDIVHRLLHIADIAVKPQRVGDGTTLVAGGVDLLPHGTDVGTQYVER